jgi:MFS family permease
VIAAVSAAFAPVLLRTHIAENVEAPSERFAFDLLRHRPYAGAVLLGTAVFLMIGTFDALWVLVFSDLHSPQWMANIGITLFAVPFIAFGSAGGRLAQRVGPFRLGAVGLFIGATFMVFYGVLPTPELMLGVAFIHAFSDGFTLSSTGVAVGVVAPPERQAGAQGLLGGVQTMVGGLTAIAAGWLYQHHGRATAFTGCAVAMLTVIAGARWLVGPTWRLSAPVAPHEPQPVAAR